jgi:tRNA U34 5-methylaminomethyl-2-thiouridine-forming methyltransferase MnmC
MGLAHSPHIKIKVLEIGFGTGLNALLAWEYVADNGLQLHYTSIERYPIQLAMAGKLNYGSLIGSPWTENFHALHTCNWEQDHVLSQHFTLHKLQGDLQTTAIGEGYQLVFFDAFAPEKQPELWTQAIFDKIYSSMASGGILTTYCAKGIVKRTLKAAGFTLESLPGPPGKREITRAIKP